MKLKRTDFPPDFRFGAATAAYQIEGHSFGNAGPSHWDTFAKGPGNVVGAEDGAIACDHYHRWEADLDLIRDAGFDAYRFSTSWARVTPDGRTPNPEGLDYYDRLVDGMLARGIEPYLTLYHWDLPSALADIGGWTNRETALRFGDYTDVVLDRIGDRMAGVATLNEPWCVAWLSHFLGHHAPGLRDIRAAARAMHHVMVAHAESMERMRARGQKNAGIVLNFEASYPATDSAADKAAAARQDAIFNRWFIGAICGQGYPEEALEGLRPHMPACWEDDMARIAAPIDWLGVNYYTRGLLKEDRSQPWPHLGSVTGPLDKTQMGWEIYPDGLREVLCRLKDDFVGDLPMMVTENGMARDESQSNGNMGDVERIGFIEGHFQAALDAIAAGVNLNGFFYWSLLDNFEWAFGFEKRFGIVHVDYQSLKRTPKASYHALKAMLYR